MIVFAEVPQHVMRSAALAQASNSQPPALAANTNESSRSHGSHLPQNEHWQQQQQQYMQNMQNMQYMQHMQHMQYVGGGGSSVGGSIAGMGAMMAGAAGGGGLGIHSAANCLTRRDNGRDNGTHTHSQMHAMGRTISGHGMPGLSTADVLAMNARVHTHIPPARLHGNHTMASVLDVTLANEASGGLGPFPSDSVAASPTAHGETAEVLPANPAVKGDVLSYGEALQMDSGVALSSSHSRMMLALPPPPPSSAVTRQDGNEAGEEGQGDGEEGAEGGTFNHTLR